MIHARGVNCLGIVNKKLSKLVMLVMIMTMMAAPSVWCIPYGFTAWALKSPMILVMILINSHVHMVMATIRYIW